MNDPRCLLSCTTVMPVQVGGQHRETGLFFLFRILVTSFLFFNPWKCTPHYMLFLQLGVMVMRLFVGFNTCQLVGGGGSLLGNRVDSLLQVG